MDTFFQQHSTEALILIMTALLLGALLVLVPQLLRSHHRSVEMQHTEHMAVVERGLPLPQRNDSARYAGRTASLVPMVTVCAAATVTCFMAVSKSESLFAVALTVWAVAGVISLAAITGGVALLGRLAQLQSEEEERERSKESGTG